MPRGLRKEPAEFRTSSGARCTQPEGMTDLVSSYREAPGVCWWRPDKRPTIGPDRLHRPVRAHELKAAIRETKPRTLVRPNVNCGRLFHSGAAPAPQVDETGQPSFASTIAGTRWTRDQSVMAAAERDKASSVALFNGASVLGKANPTGTGAETIANVLWLRHSKRRRADI